MKVSGTPRPLKVGDEEVLGIEQQFEIGTEPWNEYKLLDGGTIRIKTTMARVYRIVDKDGIQQYTAQGDPAVLVRHRQDIVATD